MASDDSLGTIIELAQLPVHDERDREKDAEKQQLAAVLDEDQSLASDAARLYELIDFAFEAAAAYGERLAGFQHMHSEATSIDQGWLAATEHSLSYFSEALVKFDHMLEEGASVMPCMQVGPMVVDCRALKEAFLPAPRACMDVLQTVLPRIAARKTKGVMERMQDAVNRLEARPGTTEEYVDNLSFIDSINEIMKAIEGDAAEVTELYALVSRFEIETTPENLAEFETAKANVVRLRDAAKAGTESMPRKITEFTDELDKDISTLGADVLVVRDDAQKEIVFDAKAELDEVLKYTAELEERMQTLQKRAALYKSYQRRFNVEVTKFSALEETHSEVKAKCTLWSTVREWRDLEKQWAATPFLEINAEDMSDAVSVAAAARGRQCA
jgi:dynein heavy chain